MQPIDVFWKKIFPKVKKRGVSLFLDYDGTLTPIIESPEKARLSSRMRKQLLVLRKTPGISLAIVSGRSIQVIRNFVRIPGLTVAGNHGYHIEKKGRKFLHPEARAFLRRLPRFEKKLRAGLAEFPKIALERKTYGLTLHYRGLSSAAVLRAGRRVKQILQPALNKNEVVLTRGKKIWELRPAARWGKGDAVLRLWREEIKSGRKPFPVYLGDDDTDEDAFRALRGKGAGIRVVNRPSKRSFAYFYLKDVKEVMTFLERLSSALRSDEYCYKKGFKGQAKTTKF